MENKVDNLEGNTVDDPPVIKETLKKRKPKDENEQNVMNGRPVDVQDTINDGAAEPVDDKVDEIRLNKKTTHKPGVIEKRADGAPENTSQNVEKSQVSEVKEDDLSAHSLLKTNDNEENNVGSEPRLRNPVQVEGLSEITHSGSDIQSSRMSARDSSIPWLGEEVSGLNGRKRKSKCCVKCKICCRCDLYNNDIGNHYLLSCILCCMVCCCIPAIAVLILALLARRVSKREGVGSRRYRQYTTTSVIIAVIAFTSMGIFALMFYLYVAIKAHKPGATLEDYFLADYRKIKKREELASV